MNDSRVVVIIPSTLGIAPCCQPHTFEASQPHRETAKGSISSRQPAEHLRKRTTFVQSSHVETTPPLSVAFIHQNVVQLAATKDLDRYAPSV